MSVKKVLSLLAIVGAFASSSYGLRCYVCNDAKSNAECTQLRKCPSGADGCQNVVRMENGLLRISKACQQFEACRSSSRQNYRQCQPAAVSVIQREVIPRNANLPPSVCRSCCQGDGCNQKPYLKEESRTGRINPKAPLSWRPVKPAIRDVKVYVLSPDTALITFSDIKNHSASFFNVQLSPRRNTRIAPVILRNNSGIAGLSFTQKLPPKTLTYLVRGLSAGNPYRISVIAKHKSAIYSKKIFKTFYTRPRPPQGIRLMNFDTNTVSVFVIMARPGNGDRVSHYMVSYRKADEPVSAEFRLPSSTRAGLVMIPDLMPSTEYIISAWTDVVSAAGRTVAVSKRVDLKVTTAVPGIAEVLASELHATNITWSFRLPYYVTDRSQERFIITVRDDTHGRILVDTTLDKSARSYTATGLRPRTVYTFSIKASNAGKDSVTAYSEPIKTLTRCYGCVDAMSRDECMAIVECSPESSGCLNVVRRHSVTNTGKYQPSSYRASLVCKQPNACDDNEKQNVTEQCNPDRNRNVDPPEVCRCCCEGDLCNGPGTTCGRVLGWLDPFRSPEQLIFSPLEYCEERSLITNGMVICSSGNEIGSVCTFTCSGGYYLVGVGISSCSNDGSWTALTPQCLELKPCPELDVEGMVLTCSNDFNGGSVCDVKCKSGYMLIGPKRVACSRQGKWKNDPPTCLQIDDCQPDPCIHGTCNDLINDYECECTPGWRGKICDTKVFCGELSAPKNGKLECTDSNKFGSRCRYACGVGYEQHGPSYVRCLRDGYWSSLELTLCVAKDCKVPPQNLMNGGTVNCTGYKVGDTCDFSCPNELDIAGGEDRITCQSDQTWSGKVPCCDLPCPPHALVDLLFLLDSSSSVGKSNWKTLIEFTNLLLDSFVIGPEDMRVGVARYNRRVDKRNEILMGDYMSVGQLRHKLNKIPYNGRGTLTGRALWHLHTESLRAPGNRPNVPDVIVIITDGKATDKVEKAAQAIRDQGVKIYVVGVVNRYNRMNMTQLASMSSGPDYLQIITEGYEKLARDLTSQLTKDVCWLPCNFKYEQWELSNRQRQALAMSEDEEFWRSLDQNAPLGAPQPTPLPSNKEDAPPEEPTVGI